MRLWDVETGRELRRVQRHRLGIRGIPSLAFSPDGKRVLYGSHDNTLRLWDVETGQELQTFTQRACPMGVTFSPNGQRVLYGSGTTLRLWDVNRVHSLKVALHPCLDLIAPQRFVSRAG